LGAEIAMTITTRLLGVFVVAVVLIGGAGAPAGVATAAASTYQAIDLGTLGGTYSAAIAVNDSDQVVGTASLAGDAAYHAFSWTQAGGIVDLTLGGTNSEAQAVNNGGQVVGDGALAGDAANHAFSWTQAGGMLDLGTLGGSDSVAHAVNDSGQVVGASTTSGTSEQHAFSWTQAGGMVDLGSLGGANSNALAVSDGGQAVGYGMLDNATVNAAYHAFSWTQAGGMVDLGTLGGTQSSAVAVNRNGQAVGDSSTSGTSGQHAFSWTQAGGMVDLGTLGGTISSATAVNDAGEVVGSSSLAGDVATHAFSWTQAGGMVDLGTLGGTESHARAVNGSGQVVGVSTLAGDATAHAFSWTQVGGMVDLGTLGGTNSQASAVNSSGQVAGYSYTAGDSEQHATLWQTSTATGFVSRDRTRLLLDGQPYRPIGLNIYNANSNDWCWYRMDGNVLDDSLTAIGSGKNAMRAWFFQQLANTNGTRDWTAFDRTLAIARAHGYKVIATLIDQWGNCGATNGQGYGYKDQTWYQTGYRQPDPSAIVSYRDWVQEVAARYKNDSTILSWQLVNEPEARVPPCHQLADGSWSCAGCDEPTAETALESFASDVSSVIKSVDPNHLVSLGTIGSGQCGTSYLDYKKVMSVPTLDLCEYHDYSPNQWIPGDVYNGLQFRIEQCNALDKPLLVGELGIKPNSVGGTFADRARAVASKLCAQLSAGVAGELLWAWDKNGSLLDNFDIGPSDPVLDVLSPWSDPSHSCSAPAAPSGAVAAAGDGSAAVSWLQPASDGGSPVTSYTITSSSGGLTKTVGGSTTSTTFSGLANGTAYTFTVTATNAAGTGVASAPSNSVTPQLGNPNPAAVTGTASTTSATSLSTGSDPTLTGGTTSSITVPSGTAGGSVSITQSGTTEPAPGGFLIGGVQVSITAPPGTATNPLTLAFTLTPAQGRPLDQTTLASTEIYRTEGSGSPTLVANCTGPPGQAQPDPCVSNRQYVTIGAATYVRLTVLTSNASVWNSAVPKPGTVAVSDSGYAPQNVTIQPGAYVNWSFSGKKSHSVTDSAGLAPSGAPWFDSGAKSSGGFSFAFPASGSFPYKSTVKGDSITGAVSVPVLVTPARGRTTANFSVIWSTTTPAGLVFDVQYRFKAAGSMSWSSWTTWQAGVTKTSAPFVPNKGAGTYAFHARLRNTGTGRASDYSPPDGALTAS
jgi:probable HAF family extracellular repeat protein